MTTTDVYEGWDTDQGELPPRPRRKLVTPATLVLTAVLVAAGGFIGGVEVQKHQGASTTTGRTATGTAAAAFANRFGGTRGAPGAGAGPGAGFPGAAGGGDFTLGTVADKHGSTLYITDSSGTTIRVKTSAAATKFTRTAATSSKGIYPGDTVIVTGAKAKDGTVTADSIRATSKSAASAGGGRGLLGGADGFPGGGPPSGAGGSGG